MTRTSKYSLAGGIPVTEENYLEFRKKYRKAVEEKAEFFFFHGHQVLISYGKYVLEYMETFSHIKPLKDEST